MAAYDEDSEGGDEESGSGEYRELLEAAFPDEDWTDDRAAAFKELIHSCMDEEEPSDEGAKKPSGPLAMLIMGKLKKKAG